MPFTGDTFTHGFDWEKDPQRQEKIVNSRLESEFDGFDTGLSALAARATALEAAPPPAAATQANQETATSTTTYVSPGRQQFHPSAAKGWVKADNAGGTSATYNVSSVADTGAGIATVNWGTDFSSANYATLATTLIASGARIATMASQAAGSIVLNSFNVAATAADSDNYFVAGFGDHA